jgi:phthiocerol/phenolphthiocerol synthesis type-I polyketide synthase E
MHASSTITREMAPTQGKSMSGTASTGDDTARQLTRIWQELLGVDAIGLDQNYFDLGGDSSAAVRLFAQIERIFNVKLPLATLFEAPTIEELAQVLRRESSPSGWSPLVVIQPEGSRPPFFCMHGAGGTVLIYRDLARCLGPNQPFYGLQAAGLDGVQPPLTRVEDMATLYVKEIRRTQAHGPYFLGGYCMGGTVAFEAAQQLRAQGEQVALLALFDTMDWSKIPIPSFLGRGYQSLQRLGFHTANFFRLDGRGKVQFFREKVKTLRSRIPVWRGMLLAEFGGDPHAGTSGSVTLAKVWQTNDRACVTYVPRPYRGLITDYRPLKQYRAFDRPDAKWDKLAEGGIDVVVVPAYPAGMLVQPFVQHLALALQKSMDEAISRSGAS